MAAEHQGEMDDPSDAAALPGAVVEADNGDEGVVQAVDRHEEEGLKLEIGPQNEHAGGGEQWEDQIHAQVHHRGQGLHQDGGDAHTKHGADDGAVRAEAPEGEAHDGAAPHHTQPHHHAHHLAQQKEQGQRRHTPVPLVKGSQVFHEGLLCRLAFFTGKRHHKP